MRVSYFDHIDAFCTLNQITRVTELECFLGSQWDEHTSLQNDESTSSQDAYLPLCEQDRACNFCTHSPKA